MRDQLNKIRKLSKRGLALASRLLKPKAESPFQNEEDRRLIVHCCHHKVGSGWFRNVLKAIADHYGLTMQVCEQSDLMDNTNIFLQNHSRVDFSNLPNYYGSHMIRDPRDIVVSGYYYHLWTTEAWANKPMSEFPARMRERWSYIPFEEAGDISYKELLNSRSHDEGLSLEIKRHSTTGMKEIAQWNYDDPDILEIKYEDIIVNEEKVFRELFAKYSFNQSAIETSLEVARKFSFANKTERKIGEVKENSHMRSGQPGQWKQEFSSEHISLYKQLHGDDIIRLGYENHSDW